MKIILSCILVLGLLASGFWFYTGPQRALRAIKIAADNDDIEGIRERVDIPAVQESLKEQLNLLMTQKLATSAELAEDPMAGLGVLFASKMAETVIETAVTPTYLAALIKGNKLAALDQDNDPGQQAISEPAATKAEVKGSFDSADRYTVRVLDKDTHKPTVALTLRRQGFSWRLTSVQLPLGELISDIPAIR